MDAAIVQSMTNMNNKEVNIIPYHVSSIPHARVALVFAPHPDDEVFGCGGALALHVQAGHTVRVILLTAGDARPVGGSDPSYATIRLAESRTAAAVLGIETPECWGILDRTVGYGEGLVARIMGAVESTGADVIYAPSLWESHPDHRATAMCAIEAVRRLGGNRTLLLYELSAPLRPNCLVDITSTWSLKAQAMDCFVSQNINLDYPDFIGSLNRYRALTLNKEVSRVEAFERYDAASLNRPALMPFQSEHRRMVQRGVPGTPQDLPLVSVIVRTMSRPTLRQTLDSLVLQTYTNIELILVDAVGDGLEQVDLNGISFPVRVASEAAQLTRSQAANLGLKAATGDFCLILDDDDWLYADHLAKLVNCAILNPSLKAVHTAVACVDAMGNSTGVVFDFPYAPGELKYGNFMPIHAVLFSRSLVGLGCSFDRNFDLYEDWDFWLQVEVYTAFAFVEGVSAAYRIDLASGSGVQVDPERAKNATAALFAKWSVYQTESTFGELITRALSRRHLLSLTESLQREVNRLSVETQRLSVESQSLAEKATLQQERAIIAQKDANAARQDAHHFRQAHDSACSDRDFARGVSDAARQEAQRSREECLQLREIADLAREEAQRSIEESQRLQELADRSNGEVLSLTSELALSRLNITRLQTSLDQEHAETLHRLDQIGLLQAQSEQSQVDLSRLLAQVEGMHATEAQLRRDLEAREMTIRDLVSSTSWKLTRPVRSIGKSIRHVRSATEAVRESNAWQMGYQYMCKRALAVVRHEGAAGLMRRVQFLTRAQFAPNGDVRALPDTPIEGRTYTQWLANFDSFDAAQLSALKKVLKNLTTRPLFSIVMPVYNTVPSHLCKAIESVKSQIYSNWELCICDDASTESHVKTILEAYAKEDSRIRVDFQMVNGHISRASNVAIGLAKGQYVAFLDHDDELSPHALLRVAQAIEAKNSAKVFYSDEDKIDTSDRRFDPYFKPDFNLGLLRSHNYMCHFAVYEVNFLRELGGLRESFEGAQDYDLALRAVDAAGSDGVVHIPNILYHWRAASGSTAAGHSEKSYAFSAGLRALTEHLARRGLNGVVEEAPEAAGMYRICWARPSVLPLISIVIPTRNGGTVLLQCLDSLRNTSYPNFEIIVVDNGSDDSATLTLLAQRQASGQIRILRDEQPFNFSALNNHAVNDATNGEFVLLLNDDIEVINPEWLDELVAPAMESGMGCVGARLWYPDGRLQHGGVILVCGVAGHAHKYLPRGHHGYMGRAVLAQDMVGVTAACLLVRKSIYLEVGGLDEGLAVAFNDIDFCLRVHSAGYRNHWTPYAELIHHESVSRGYEDTPEKQMRFRSEIDKMQTRWPALLAHDDPCYNPNLTAEAEDFSLAWPPRRVLP